MSLFPHAAILALLADLAAADVRATIDPAKVNTPAVWLRMGPVDLTPVLCGETSGIMTAEATCIVPDTTDEAALDALAALVDAVVPHVDVVGPLRFQGTVLPGPDLTPLPSIVIPVAIGPNPA